MSRRLHLLPLLCFIPLLLHSSEASVPIVINTWNFTDATASAWSTLMGQNASAVETVAEGCTTCEVNQCDKTVGYGGSPDEKGETTLDAMIFDGTAMDMGAVGGLRRVKSAIKVAQHVLQYTKHSLLAGDLATQFAYQFHFKVENLATDESIDMWEDWYMNRNCQPNFWQNVKPDPAWSCGPYSEGPKAESRHQHFDSFNHDTIGMIVVDKASNVVAGTSSNGASHKIPGRVGDAPLPGAGAYADSDVGAAVATGDGDVMMRFLPSFLAVEEMRRGSTPTQAAQTAISRISRKYPDFMGAVIAVTKTGDFGAACNGIDTFPFSVASEEFGGVVLKTVKCTQPDEPEANVLQIV